VSVQSQDSYLAPADGTSTGSGVLSGGQSGAGGFTSAAEGYLPSVDEGNVNFSGQVSTTSGASNPGNSQTAASPDSSYLSPAAGQPAPEGYLSGEQQSSGGASGNAAGQASGTGQGVSEQKRPGDGYSAPAENYGKMLVINILS
jgi:hypothetical protein